MVKYQELHNSKGFEALEHYLEELKLLFTPAFYENTMTAAELKEKSIEIATITRLISEVEFRAKQAESLKVKIDLEIKNIGVA